MYASRSISRTLRHAARKALALLLSALMALPPVALAQTVPSGGTSTTVLPNGSGNGVPVVNIAPPNAAGLSHNKFNSYNVPTQGQILNNSAVAVQTQLGGTILGNPNVAGARATLILNEVVQPNRSLLRGYQEVAGQAAQVVIANPYGITCSGCGFINTPRATLTTGVPALDAGGNLTGFSVRQGDILINGGGLDATGQDYFDLVARSVVFQGQVNAKDLLVAAGSNDFAYGTRAVTPAAPAGAAPAYAIDSSALGGMYVDRIRFVATEAGVGVRMLGDVGAFVDDITLSSAGKIELTNRMSAQRDIRISYTRPSWSDLLRIDSGQVYAGRDLTISGGAGLVSIGDSLVGAGGNLTVTGESIVHSANGTRFADGNITYSAAMDLDLAGTYDAGGALSFSASDVHFQGAELIGRSATSDINVTATNFDLVSAEVNTAGSVILNASGNWATSAARIAAGGDVSITYAGAAFANTGTIAASGDIRFTNTAAAASLTNEGYLEAAGSLTLGSPTLGAFGTGASSTTLATALVSSAASISNAGYLQADSATLAGGSNLSNSGTMVLGTDAAHANTLALGQLANSGTLYGGGHLSVATTGTITSSGTIIADGSLVLDAASVDLSGGTTYAAADLAVTTSGTLTMGGSFSAGNDVTVNAGTLSDTAPGATRAAGRDFTLSTTGNLVLYSGQVYDAGRALGIAAPNVWIATDTASAQADTVLSSGGSITITTDDLTLGSTGASSAAGSLQAAGGVTLAPRAGALSVRVRGAATDGTRSSIQAGGGISSRADSFTVDGDVLANGGITLRPVANGGTSSLVINDGGWMEAGGTLSVTAGAFDARGFDATINAGGTLAGNALDLFLGDLDIFGGVGNVGLLQGGTGGGRIDVDALNLSGAFSHLKANRSVSALTEIHVGGAGNTSPFNNLGLVYAEGHLELSANGDIVNTSLGTIASGFGDLTISPRNQSSGANGRFDNQGLVYAGRDLALYIPQDGTLYNAPSGTLGAGRHATLGIFYDAGNPAPAHQSTVQNEGRIEIAGDAEINANLFRNNAPTSVVRNTARLGEGRTYSGDSGRYGVQFDSPGWDAFAAATSGVGNGLHTGRAQYGKYMIDANPGKLYSDYVDSWVERDELSNPSAATPQIEVGGNLVIRTHTGQNIAGDIFAAGDLSITKLHASFTGTSFTNQSLDLYEYSMRSYGRSAYSCENPLSDVSCVGTQTPLYLGDAPPATWLAAWGPKPSGWGHDDGVAHETHASLLGSRVASLRAGGVFSPSVDVMNNTSSTVGTPTTVLPVAVHEGAATPKGANPTGAQTPVPPTAPDTTTIGGATVTLPTGPNGMFITNQDPDARYLVESNPLYASAYNPFLGSDYLAGLLGLEPDEQILRLGDANYEARLIRDQIQAQTGASVLRTAYDAYDQQKLLMDNASLEAKALKLNFGAALTAEQVAALKHDIVWMVEQVVQGRKVLVPVVYLSSATRAEVSGASIVADTAIVTGDSFLNRGGEVKAANALVVVTRQDIVNSSGDISAGTIQMQSLEGDIINRTETFRNGSAGNYTTSAGRSGGIFASNDLFLKAGRDVNVQGADIRSEGTATVLAGRDVNVTALVLESRNTAFADRSGVASKDVSRSVETTQAAHSASISGVGGVVVGARNNVNVTGAFVGSDEGTTTLLSESGKVNIQALALTNTRTESQERIGLFAESSAGVPQSQGVAAPTQKQATSRAGTASAADDKSARPAPDPSTTSAQAFTGLAIEKSDGSSSATTNMGSLVQGNRVQIIAQGGDVNVQGSEVQSGKGGTLIDAKGDVNITAAYDTASSTRSQSSTRIGVGAEASADGAHTGLRVTGSTLESDENSRTASTSRLGSEGTISIRAGNRLTNEGTSIDAKGNVNIQAASVENLAATNSFTSNTRSTNFDVSLMAGGTTNGMGQSIANLAQGTGQQLNIAAPEAQLRLRAQGSSSETTGGGTTAVVTDIKAGGSVNYQVSGQILDQGTSYSAGRNINIDAGSYENRAAQNTTFGTSRTTSGGGTATVGVDATRSVNARISVSASNATSSDDSSTAVTGSLKAGGSVNIRTRGDTTLEGTKVEAGQNVNVDAGGNLNLLQANNRTNRTSSSQEGSANVSASACLDLSCASGGLGASARTTESTDRSTTGVAGSIKAGGNVNLRSANNMTLQGTNIESAKDTTLDAGGNVDFQALTSTINRSGRSDGAGVDVGLNVGASGKLASDGGGNVSLNFERGRDNVQGTERQGGSVTAGGSFNLRSGGNARLEGTGVTAGSANVDVGGNFTMESAQSTFKQDTSNVTGSLQLSGGKSSDGGRNFGGAIGFGVNDQKADNVVNQNAGITTRGGTRLNVGGNATLAGANIDAGGGVSGQIRGNLSVETRADQIRTESTNINAYAGVGDISLAGKGGGSTTRAQKIDAAQDKVGNVANTIGGTGVFIDAHSSKTDQSTVTQRSGISGGQAGLGGLSVGGNANLSGASASTTGMNVAGTTTTTAGPQERNVTSSSDFTLRGTVSTMLGSDQATGGTFSNVFQASGGQKPRAGAGNDAAPAPTTRPRSNAVSGDAARPRVNAPDAAPTTRPRSNAVSGDAARPRAESDGPVRPQRFERIEVTPAPELIQKVDAQPMPRIVPRDSDPQLGASPKPPAAPPGRPRSESVGPASNPNPTERPFGTFEKPAEPGNAPSTFSEFVRDRDGWAAFPGPKQNDAKPKPLAEPVQKPAPLPPIALSTPKPSSTPPGRDRSESVGPASNPNPRERPFGAFGTESKPGSVTSTFNEIPVRPRSNALRGDDRAPKAGKPDAPRPNYGALPPVDPAKRPAADVSTFSDVPPPDRAGYGAFPAPKPKPAANDAVKPGPQPLALAAPAARAGEGRPEGKFKLKNLGSEYVGENKGEGERWKKGNEDFKVRYFDAKERDAAEIIIRDGKFYAKETDASGNVLREADGSPKLKPFDTRGRPDQQGAIFVMDAEGRLYATTEQERGKVHHSSLLAGEPIAMAGELRVENGELTTINNMSGHYRPDLDQFRQMNEHLKSQKVDLGSVHVEAATGLYRPEDKGHTGDQILVRLDVETGKVTDVISREKWVQDPETKAWSQATWTAPDGTVYAVMTRGEINANGPVTPEGWKLSEPVAIGSEAPRPITPEQRAQLELAINAKGEVVYKADPERKFDTGEGRVPFVVDAAGRLYAGKTGGLAHASLAEGGPVRVAGEVAVKDGKLVHIDNKSAEYASSSQQLVDVIVDLRDQQKLDAAELQGYELWENQVVDNGDGTQRPVMFKVDPNTGAVVRIEDPGPPSAGHAAEPVAPTEGSASGADTRSANDDALRRAA
ncbi:MAG TPA: hemagglutinin repeat-containing protein [Burkholderiales bacterium]|nr:hemagglutinin repeat-containing protein [Burkholderiales bacterium]